MRPRFTQAEQPVSQIGQSPQLVPHISHVRNRPTWQERKSRRRETVPSARIGAQDRLQRFCGRVATYQCTRRCRQWLECGLSRAGGSQNPFLIRLGCNNQYARQVVRNASSGFWQPVCRLFLSTSTSRGWFTSALRAAHSQPQPSYGDEDGQ